jgi:DNA replication protein DnaC
MSSNDMTDEELEKLNQELIAKREANKQTENLSLMDKLLLKDLGSIDKLKEHKDNLSKEHAELKKKVGDVVCKHCNHKFELGLYDLKRLSSKEIDKSHYKCNCDRAVEERVIAFKIKCFEQISNKLPSRYSDKTIDNYETTNTDFKKNLKLSAKELKGLIVHGKTGTGKTHVAIAYARTCMANMMGNYFKNHEERTDVPTPKFVIATIPDMLSAIIEKENTMHYYKSADVLIIDDLGAETPKDWASEKTFELINYRYNEEMLTIVTTNLTPKEIQSTIGTRIFSRLMEMCDVMELNGEDYRLRKYKKKE